MPKKSLEWSKEVSLEDHDRAEARAGGDPLPRAMQLRQLLWQVWR